MGFWRALFSIGTAVVGVVIGAPVLVAIGGIGLITALGGKSKPEDRAAAAEAHGARQDATIYDINDELTELDAKARRDGNLNPSDAARARALRAERDAAVAERNAATVEAQEQRDKAGLVIPVEISPEKLHVIDAHVGQGLLNEVCPDCNRPMLLQKRQKTDPRRPLDGYAMSCTGFFEKVASGLPACSRWVSVDPGKLTLQVDIKQTDFQHSRREIQAAIDKDQDQAKLVRRLREHRRRHVPATQCPVHKEGLLLREKRDPTSLLDTFYLRCNHCEHTVKLKTAGQLSLVLHQLEGIGLIA